MEFKGLKINLAELAMALTALGALISAWRGSKAAKKKESAGKGKVQNEPDDTENRPGD